MRPTVDSVRIRNGFLLYCAQVEPKPKPSTKSWFIFHSDMVAGVVSFYFCLRVPLVVYYFFFCL